MPASIHRLRLVALAVAAVLAGFVMGGLAVTGYASAWGDGSICWQDQTYTFQTEQTYYQFLNSHPDATEGRCIPTTTTTGVTSSLPTTSSPTTPTSTVTPSTSPATSTSTPTTSSPATSGPPPSTPSAPSSTLSPQPGEMCASSTNSDISPATSSGCSIGVTVTSSPTARPSSSATSATALPKTGPDVTGWLIAAIVALGIGYSLVLFARKAK